MTKYLKYTVAMVFVSSILTLQQIMKFTYTHITKDYTEITEYNISKNNKVNTKKIRLVLDNINVINNKICTKQ